MTRGREVSLSALNSAVVLLSAVFFSRTTSAPNVGCLFTERVCQEGEVCFDDLVIGRCISATTDDAELNSVGPLAGPPLNLLAAEMRRVFSQGYTWEDDYSQCVFQTLLRRIENKEFYSAELCAHLLPSEWGDPRNTAEDEPRETDDIESTSLDSDLNGEGEFQLVREPIEDEEEEQAESQLSLRRFLLTGQHPGQQPGQRNIRTDRDIPSHIQPWTVNDVYRLEPDAGYMSEEDVDQLPLVPSFTGYEYLRPVTLLSDQTPVLQQEDEEDNEEVVESVLGYPLSTSYGAQRQQRGVKRRNLSPDRIEQLVADQSVDLPSVLSDEEPLALLPNDDLPEIIPVYFPIDDSVELPSDYPVYIPLDDDIDDADNLRPSLAVDYVPETRRNHDDYDESMVVAAIRAKRPAGTAAAREWVVLDEGEEDADGEEEDGQTDENISTYDFDYNDSSASETGDNDDTVYYSDEASRPQQQFPVETIFDRHERLDVKKPGPFYANSQNNFFLDKLLALEGEEEDRDYSKNEHGQTEYEMPLTMKSKQKKSFQITERSPVLGYEAWPEQTSYLVVNIKDRLRTLGQATNLVQAVAEQLGIPGRAFGQPKLSATRVSVPVLSNPRQLNASAMARALTEQLDEVSKKIADDTGVVVDSFASGTEGTEVLYTVFTGHSRLFLALFLLTAGLASVLVVGALLLLLRRRRGKKIHLKQEKDNKEEPVKEYKQLVRDWSRSSRASQGSNGAPSNGTASEDRPAAASSEDGGKRQPPAVQPLGGRQGKLHNSEGSRTSSTSSWQEEPGVTTMDISTGHMVLAYMEDHLNNKQRLEQEWVGLCAYEAEPAATSVAFKVENKKKNRYPDKLPYDHNRVLLNALINGNNSDYINASTLTDHDPRNPAYIVTQGPMAHTIADFWQMVWEQGSVVIVMLSRLTENGYQLVQRYWPEEGSNQYHIYEVHLVSEHVWCEDYLVRSLYLKNTQTGETRTVTQFHFLSWPDGSVPSTSKPLLEFRRKVNKSYRGRSCPIIVHCSDGVGRCGTYVLIDMVLNRMNKGSKEIDIAATLEHIRDQRSGMVQTRSQFEFCLTAVAEETHAVLKVLAQ